MTNSDVLEADGPEEDGTNERASALIRYGVDTWAELPLLLD